MNRKSFRGWIWSGTGAALALLFLDGLVAGDAAAPVTSAAPQPGWREDFAVSGGGLPAGWEVKRKFGTRGAAFSTRAAEGAADGVLAMVADRATASVIVNPTGVNLKATPILRWRWRVLTLPTGGDGRASATDDQAIGIYVGTGSTFSKRSVSYRWDTVTPSGSVGDCAYGAGTIRIHWFTLRNQDDGLGQWRVEERNLAEDFQSAWGQVPTELYVSISCNSQYTGSKAEAELDWIEFVPVVPPPEASSPPSQPAASTVPATP